MFSQEQLKIAQALLEDALSLNELAKQFELSKEQLQKELARMVELKVVEEKDGVFSLKKEIINELRKRKDIAEKDYFKLRLIAYIELQALEEEMLSKYLKEIIEKMKADEDITIYSIETADIQKLEKSEYYSSYIEANFSIRDLTSLMRFMFVYGPSTVEVIKPEKFEITAADLQEALTILSDISLKYNKYLRRAINKQELEEFYKKIQGK